MMETGMLLLALSRNSICQSLLRIQIRETCWRCWWRCWRRCWKKPYFGSRSIIAISSLFVLQKLTYCIHTLDRVKSMAANNTLMMFCLLSVVVVGFLTQGGNADGHGHLHEHTFTMALPPMKPGEVLFTLPGSQAGVLEMPKGHIAIKSFNAELVYAANTTFQVNEDESNYDEADFRPVPISQLYNHHYIAYDLTLPKYAGNEETFAQWVRDQDKSFANGPCGGLPLPFGGGTEMAQAAIQFQDPYGFVLKGTEIFGLNLHFIDLRGVPEDEVQLCVQCNCEYLDKHNAKSMTNSLDLSSLGIESHDDGGGAQCCSGGRQCNSILDDSETLQYYFRYKVTWKDFVQGETIPLYSSVLSASSEAADQCFVEYNSPLCVDTPTKSRTDTEDYTMGTCIKDNTTALIEYSWQLDSDINFVYGYGHTHIGTIDGVQVEVFEPSSDSLKSNADEDSNSFTRDILCASHATYGVPNSSDENFVVGMGVCDYNLSPRLVPKGSVIRLSSQYNGLPTPFKVDQGGDGIYDVEVKYGAPYDGAMAYLFMYYTFTNMEHSFFSDVPESFAMDASTIGDIADDTNADDEAMSCDLAGPFTDIRQILETRSETLQIASDLDGELTLHWRLSPEEDHITYGIEYTYTGDESRPSWIAIGVGANGMIDSDMIVVDFMGTGADSSEDAVSIEQYWSITYGKPVQKSDIDGAGLHDLSNCGRSSVLSGGDDFGVPTVTEYIQFARPLEGEDMEYSNDVIPSSPLGMSYAMGLYYAAFDIFDYHGPMNRGRVVLDLPESFLAIGNE